MMRLAGVFAALLFAPWVGSVSAAEADVVGVAIKQRDNGLYQFDVTIDHPDQGWEHYVDKWDVLGPDGSVIASRTHFAPNDGAVPFTRSLVGVKLPVGAQEVTVRAHDTEHGYGGKTMTVVIP